MKNFSLGVIDEAGNAEGIAGLTIDEDLEDQFTYHTPTPEMRPKFKHVSDILMLAAQVIRNNCPESANTTIALQHLVDARMRANAAIALEGRGFKRKGE